MTNLKKAGLAAVGAHALYKAHNAGVYNKNTYSGVYPNAPLVMKAVNYGLGAAGSVPMYPLNRLANLFYDKNKERDDQSAYYKMFDIPRRQFMDSQYAVIDIINKEINKK
jgi:hypothetical protein